MTDIKSSVGRYTGTQDLRHKGCGGQLMVSGTGRIKLPLGFGFDGTGKGNFVVDYVEFRVVSGFCFKCAKEGTFVKNGNGKKVRRKPRGLNKRIKAKLI